jgi:hypothetical protein
MIMKKFLNNGSADVVGIDEGEIIFDKGEIIRNGASLHLDQGIAVTSNASQAKTPTRSFSALRFGRLARRTKRNFTSPCRGLVSRCMSLLTAKCGMPSLGRTSDFLLRSYSIWPRKTEA